MAGVDAAAVETIFRDVSSLRFRGLELFSWQIEGMEANGGLGRFVEKHNLPLIDHLHLKDWVGGPAMQGYCPLRQGKVDLAAVLKLIDGRPMPGMAMVELDSGGQLPQTPLEMARIARTCAQSQGVSLRS